ncbi:hypothetical protein [Bartonella sp. LJL80]
MSFIGKKIIGAALGATMLVSGCTTTSTAVDPSNMTPTEIALRQQQTERTRIVQGVATGAVIGALAGAAIGAVAGGDSKSITRGAIIGGVGGGVVGGADANRVNQQTRGIAAEQDGLRKVIASADKNIAYYSKASGLTQKLAAEDANRIANSKKRLASGAISKDAYKKEVNNARANVKLVDQYVKDADQDIADLKRATSGSNSAAAQQRVRELTAQRNQLKTQLSRMQTAVSRADA